MDLPVSATRTSRFYLVMGLAVGAIVVLGFSRTYFLRVWFTVPPLTVWLHLHGLAQTLWLVLFVAQAHLIATHRRNLHRALGVIASVVAAFSAVATLQAALEAARLTPARGGISQVDRLYGPIVLLGLFVLFVAAGLVLRKNREIHKRCMLLACITVVGPGAARAVSLLAGHGVRDGHVPIMAGLLLAALIHDWWTRGRPHWVLLSGSLLLIISQLTRRLVGGTELWTSIGGWLIG